ncbi:MAG: hypothetical protein Q4G47_04310 [Lachnospiraceae bacterium]|nr:hypothetical protein [Lachnospiraceae bacterium]
MMKKAIASLAAASLILGTAVSPMASDTTASDAAVSEVSEAQEAEPEKKETAGSEAKSDQTNLGSLIDSLIEQGKETYSELSGQATEILGNNGVIEKLLGPDSEVITTISSLSASLSEAREQISVSLNEVMGTISEDGGELGSLISSIKVTVATSGGELVSSAKEVVDSFKKDKKSTASKLLGLASTYLGIELPPSEEEGEAGKADTAESSPEKTVAESSPEEPAGEKS